MQLLRQDDFKYAFGIILDTKTTNKARKKTGVIQAIEVQQLFDRHICIWGQIQKYFCGYDVHCCKNACQYCCS